MENSVYHCFVPDNNTIKTSKIPADKNVNIGVNGIALNGRLCSVKSDRSFTMASNGDFVPLCWDDQLKQRDVRVMTPKSSDSKLDSSTSIERHTLTYDHESKRSARPKICERQLKDRNSINLFNQAKILHGGRAVSNILRRQEDSKENTDDLLLNDTKHAPEKESVENDEQIFPLISMKQNAKLPTCFDNRLPAQEILHSENGMVTKVHVSPTSTLPSPRGGETKVKSILKHSTSTPSPVSGSARSPRVMFRTGNAAPDLTLFASTPSTKNVPLPSRPYSHQVRSRTAPPTTLSHPRAQSMRGLVRGFYLHKSIAAQGASFTTSYYDSKKQPLFFNFVSQATTERRFLSYKSKSLPVSRRSGRSYMGHDNKPYCDEDVDADRVPQLELQRKSSEPGEAPAIPNTPVSAAAFTNIETEESETELDVPVPQVKVTFGERH